MTRPVEQLCGTGVVASDRWSDGALPVTIQAVDAAFHYVTEPGTLSGTAARLGVAFGFINEILAIIKPHQFVKRRLMALLFGAQIVPNIRFGLHVSSITVVTMLAWVSVLCNVVCLAPAALIGAGVGLIKHLVSAIEVNMEENVWARGDCGTRDARNEHTFAFMEPVQNIPQHYYFLSSDRFGIDLRELSAFDRARQSRVRRRPLINPHTNAPFSANDVSRLREHPSLLFASP